MKMKLYPIVFVGAFLFFAQPAFCMQGSVTASEEEIAELASNIMMSGRSSGLSISKENAVARARIVIVDVKSGRIGSFHEAATLEVQKIYSGRFMFQPRVQPRPQPRVQPRPQVEPRLQARPEPSVPLVQVARLFSESKHRVSPLPFASLRKLRISGVTSQLLRIWRDAGLSPDWGEIREKAEKLVDSYDEARHGLFGLFVQDVYEKERERVVELVRQREELCRSLKEIYDQFSIKLNEQGKAFVVEDLLREMEEQGGTFREVLEKERQRLLENCFPRDTKINELEGLIVSAGQLEGFLVSDSRDAAEETFRNICGRKIKTFDDAVALLLQKVTLKAKKNAAEKGKTR